ncbi:DUF2783 domain-containing protein [Roseobacter litoralis]|uniref:DUF2783 domain-containing protein n=1 Tax=Roseobacter litoralis TaxID=42443 RepID=UPI002493992F|nr:DUF2783 domain-containing protein [Roseobacter litoralis]
MTIKPNPDFPADDFYAALLEAHKGLSDTQSHALNARLVLIFANEIGDLERLNEILNKASPEA